MKKKRDDKRKIAFFVLSGLVIMVGLVFYIANAKKNSTILVESKGSVAVIEGVEATTQQKNKPEIPSVVKAVYVTMYTAGNREKIDALIQLTKDTEVNAMVIDVKGSEGELIFDMLDIATLLEELREADIHTIARIVVFQDNSAVERAPETVIKKSGGGVWRDRRGFAWVDPAAEKGWDYVFDVSKRALDAGFDEINYDYIRFPTDGALSTMVYPVWDEQTTPRYEAIKKFALRAREVLKAHEPRMSLSIDIFGYTFIQQHDLGIGQRLEDMIEAFDFVYPMVYPSHYSTGNFGFVNPADHPYEVVKGTLESGLTRMGENATSSAHRIRPWLQSFNLGAIYTSDMMHAQIQGTRDGLGGQSSGWLLWDPKNQYKDARIYLEKE
ncbi:MAG: putative glycoside hydrolase [Candidatus Azambacteria bacterium]|nr:putative glycoside hydrolase [Candidatus Azambacteria bacterium]